MAPADQHARDTALDLSRSVIVEAPAGSGKTGLLTQRYLACLAQVDRPEKVLAVTFTRRAAAEMKERIARALAAAADCGHTKEPATEDSPISPLLCVAREALAQDRHHGWGLSRNLNRMRVMTFDALQMSLATDLPLLSGLSADIGIDMQPRLVYEQAVHDLLAELDDPEAPGHVREAIAGLLAAADNQAERLVGPLMDLLAQRAQWRHALADDTPGDDVLHRYVAASIAHARDVLDRHAPSLDQALAVAAAEPDFAALWDITGLPPAQVEDIDAWRAIAGLLLTADGGWRSRLDKRQGLPPKSPAKTGLLDWLGDVSANPEGETIRDALDRVRRLPDPAYPPVAAAFRAHLETALQRLSAHLLHAFEERGQVDFAEIALRALQVLAGDSGVSDVLQRLDYGISHILVDEMQDTSRGQFELLARLTEGWTAGDGHTLFLVGDAQQSIYQFRQAEVELFLALIHSGRLGSVPLERVRLSANFRSAPEVVEWSNEAFAQVMPPRADPWHGGVPLTPGVAERTDLAGGVTVHPVFDSREAEAEAVAATLRDLRTRRPEASIALLVRARGQLRAILPALRRAGVAYSATEIDPIQARTGVRDVVAMVRALRHPGDRHGWMRLLRSRCVGLCWADVLVVANCAPEDQPVLDGIEAALAGDGLSDDARTRLGRLLTALDNIRGDGAMRVRLPAAVRGLWRALDGPSTVTETGAADVDRVLEVLDRHCPSGALEDMPAFEAAIAGLYASPAPNGVEVMTIHKSKGLEYDAVVVAGLGEDTVRGATPMLHYQALPEGFLVAPRPARGTAADAPEQRLFSMTERLQRDRERQEQRRLLYVACTRAGDTLHLFGRAGVRRDGTPFPGGGSLLELLWPAVEHDYAAAAPDAFATQAPVDAPSRPGPALPHCTRLAEARHLASVPAPPIRVAGAAVVRATDGGEEDGLPHTLRAHDQRSRDRIIGTVYHELMARLIDAGGHFTRDQRQSWLRHATARALELGLAKSMGDCAGETVIRLLERTMADPAGAWLLAPGTAAERELRLFGRIDGADVEVVLDRLIHTPAADWLIDYKSTPAWLDHPPGEATIAAEVERHRRQLAVYDRLLQEWSGQRPRYRALYFPTIACLETVPLAAAA